MGGQGPPCPRPQAQTPCRYQPSGDPCSSGSSSGDVAPFSLQSAYFVSPAWYIATPAVSPRLLSTKNRMLKLGFPFPFSRRRSTVFALMRLSASIPASLGDKPRRIDSTIRNELRL